MIDLVIPFMNNPDPWDNNELRYSLRSVEKHLKNIRFVFVVGDWPEWLCNAIHINIKQTGHKSQNIMIKLLTACGLPGLSDEFMMWNDDFFLTKNVYAPIYPMYRDGELLMDEHWNNEYLEYVRTTHSILKTANKPTLNYDVHKPIVYNKIRFVHTMLTHDFNEKLLIKSLYGNTWGNGGVKCTDCKIRRPLMMDDFLQAIKGTDIFSIGDESLKNDTVKNYLQAMFPEKSRYEK